MNNRFQENRSLAAIKAAINSDDLKVTRDYYFVNYPMNELHRLLWRMYSGWLYNASQLPDGKELADMLLFFEETKQFMEVSYSISQNEKHQQVPPETSLPQHGNYKGLIDLIAQALKPEKIFLLNNLQKDNFQNDYAELLIVFQGDTGKRLLTIEPLAEFIIAPFSNISCSLYVSERLTQLLNEGSVFHNIAFTAENLVYSDGSKELPRPPAYKLAAIKEKATKIFNIGLSLAKSFFIAAEVCCKTKETRTTTFMLQQATELTFRAIIKAFWNADQKTHSISTLQKHTRRITPQLNELFPTESANDQQLLQLLDSSYLEARYGEEFIITEPQLSTLFERVKTLIETAEIVFIQKMAVLDIAE